MQKKVFLCDNCHRAFAFGETEAYCCGDDSVFCSLNCVYKFFYIDKIDWRYEDKYEIDESNGFGINRIGNNCYGNGKYFVLDKCPFELDEDYVEEFEVKEVENEIIKLLNEKFDILEFKSVEVSTSYKHGKSLVDVFGHTYQPKYFNFIIKMLTNGAEMTPANIKLAVSDILFGSIEVKDVLFIVCNEKRAVLFPIVFE